MDRDTELGMLSVIITINSIISIYMVIQLRYTDLFRKVIIL